MSKFQFKKRQFDDVFRIKFILVLLVCVLALTLSIPSLARYKNYVNLEAMFNEIQTWDGTIADGFNSGSGTEEDPYIISDASEFAYFATSIDENGYAGTYFKLSKHIVINDGLFGYDETNITYTLKDTVFYLSEYSGNAYANSDLSGNIISSVNMFEQIENFRGYFDGDYHTIYGLYLTEDTDELALFKNLSGKVENVYFKNSFVYGGASTAILANNASYAEVNNVSTDGIVVGKGSTRTSTFVQNLDDYSTQKIFTAVSHDINLDVPVGYSFDNVTFTGNAYIEDPSVLVYVDGTNVVGDFNLQLSNDVNTIKIADGGMALKISQIKFTNMVVTYQYNYPVTSGFVAVSNGSNFNNVINKAKVYGTNVAGLVGQGTDLSISNGYNLGDLKGTSVSGIINSVVNNDSTVIDKVYNNGVLTGDKTNLVGTVSNSGSLLISNSFNAQAANNTFGNVSGTVQVTNMYDVNNSNTSSGTLTGNINVVSADGINKSLLVNTLGFGEYVDNEDLINNPNNVWVYEYEETPILYIDELNNPIASLNLGIYSWNDLGYELNTRKFTESKAFNVTTLNGFTNLKNIYYYLHEGETPLSKSEINAITDWTLYEDIVTLDMEGYYIIYVKVVEQNDYNYYINSDVVLFDLFGPDINVSDGEKVWNTYDVKLDSIYISESTSLNVSVSDKYSDVVKSEYFVSQIFVSQVDLEQITEWNVLDGSVVIDEKGPNIVYVRSEDSNGHINVVNSDYIIYGGYNEDLSIGSTSFSSVSEANITNKSSVLYKFTYNEDIPYTDGYNTKLILSNKLPENTLITLIDHKLNTVYSYEVSVEDTTEIGLNKFSMVGNTNEILFDDIAYLVADNKEVSIIFDFSAANVESNLSFNVYLELRDKMDNIVLSTLRDTIKNTNIYIDGVSELTIVNKSVIYGINYDSDSKNVIDFEYSFNSLVQNDVLIKDSYYEDLKSGISIKLVDHEGNVIDKKYLKNMEFIVGGVNYFADSDGVVRINMSNGVDKVTGSLTIVTYENDLDLTEGNYSLVITPFVASDGKYTNNTYNSNISIPIVSDYQEILDFEFNVHMNDENKILAKDSGVVIVPFDIISNNEFENPSVRVSLYRKEKMTAYEQKYVLVDLDDYSSNELVVATDYSYVVSGNKLELNLDLSSMEKTGYELRFELFDGDRRIDLIKKKFIVR